MIRHCDYLGEAASRVDEFSVELLGADRAASNCHHQRHRCQRAVEFHTMSSSLGEGEIKV